MCTAYRGHGGDLLLIVCVLCIEPFGHGADLLACVLCVEPFGHGGDLLACVLVYLIAIWYLICIKGYCLCMQTNHVLYL